MGDEIVTNNITTGALAEKAKPLKDEDIEKFLLGKLNDLILEVSKTEKPLSQVSQLPHKFNKLKTIIENELIKTSSNRISREELYNLNNLLSEWQSKQVSHFAPESLYFSPTFAHTIDKFLDRLSKDFSHKSPSPSLSHPHPGDSNTDKGYGESQVPQPESNHETIQDVIPEAAYRWSNPYVDEKSVRGTKDKEVFLRRLILPRPPEKDVVFRMFGLIGMRGIGKTTLTQMVFNHPNVRKHYLPRLWVCVSKQPEDDKDPKKVIVQRILTSLGVEDEIIEYADKKHGLKGLLYALRQQLLDKRYLIVLDDVYIEDEEYLGYISNLDKNIRKCEAKLAYALPKEHGGAIIVTSRSKEIAKKLVGEENLHKVLPLSGADCWEIFKYTYEEEEKEERKSMSDDMKSLENKIIEKCRGLPLAAKMMGEIARNRKQNDGTN